MLLYAPMEILILVYKADFCMDLPCRDRLFIFNKRSVSHSYLFDELFEEVIHLLLHVKSGELYPVDFLPLQPVDVKRGMKSWDQAFNWGIYFGYRNVELYKLVIRGNDNIQGVIALERKADHVYIHLIESAPHNRFDKIFDFVGETLVAFACQRSLDLGYEGFVALDAKTHLIAYYARNMLATHIGGGRMIINEANARKLIMLYLK